MIQFKKESYYRYMEHDCGVHRPGPRYDGRIVRYIEPLGKGCHLVQCPMGNRFRAYDDELQPLERRLMAQVGFNPQFLKGDRIICLDDTQMNDRFGRPIKMTLKLFDVYTVIDTYGSRIVHIDVPEDVSGLWVAKRFELVGRKT